MKTLVSILNHNLPEYTDYLYDNLSPYQSNIYDLIVIDNGSSSEKISKYTTHTLDSNSYMGGGFNAAMQLVLSSDEYDSLLFLNNDLIVFGYEFVKTLREEMFNNNFKVLSACFFNVEPTGQCFLGNSFDFVGAGLFQGTGTFAWNFGPNAIPSSAAPEQLSSMPLQISVAPGFTAELLSLQSVLSVT